MLNLVSSNESHLLDLALAEKLDDLNRVAAVVSRLGKKCFEPALQGFQHNQHEESWGLRGKKKKKKKTGEGDDLWGLGMYVWWGGGGEVKRMGGGYVGGGEKKGKKKEKKIM